MTKKIINFNSNVDNKQTWLTPLYIIKALGKFDVDPCAALNQPWKTAKKQYTKLDNGLSKKWKGRVWCNPPYGKEVFIWLHKLAEHKNGIALIFARTETIGFHSEIWNKAHSIFFFKGRLCFYYITGEKGSTANAPSCLVSYSNNNTKRIKKAITKNKIKGHLIIL